MAILWQKEPNSVGLASNLESLVEVLYFPLCFVIL